MINKCLFTTSGPLLSAAGVHRKHINKLTSHKSEIKLCECRVARTDEGSSGCQSRATRASARDGECARK